MLPSLVEQIKKKHALRIIDYDPRYRNKVASLAERAFGYTKDSYWATRDLDRCDKAFLALINDKVVGTVELGFIKLKDGLHAQIGYIFVDPEYRHMGIGSMLVSKSLEFLSEKGVKAVWALTSPNNTATRALFRKFGFHEFYNPMELRKLLSKRDIGKLLYKMIYWRGDIILYKPLREEKNEYT